MYIDKSPRNKHKDNNYDFDFEDQDDYEDSNQGTLITESEPKTLKTQSEIVTVKESI